jgi:uncharacterized membrane protein
MSQPLTPERYDRLDALRGAAMVWMTVFHLCFDLDQYKWITQNFYRDPFWTWQRVCIVTLFVVCAGASQAIAAHQGQSWVRFWRRWLQIVGCALLVTVGSYAMFPSSFIYFGILHCIAVMMLIARFTAGWGRGLWLAGAVVFVLNYASEPAITHWPQWQFLNAKAFNWIGLISDLPRTEDYAPLVPWLGVMWWSMAATQWLLRQRPATLTAPVASYLQPLAWLGGISLLYYMVHQPVMIGLMELAQRLR